ncbi:hypothetical protein DCC79_07400 [bacterium]|nr:hypothetical protein [Chloroflexi bacterium CFX6]RIL10627.1 MAG: hypothetical protein DCC79_07400 [bacterium]
MQPSRRTTVVIGLAVTLALVLGSHPAGAVRVARTAGAPPSSPTWPAPDLVAKVRDMLRQYYALRADPATPIGLVAPRFESEKVLAKKDPDTLWEYHVNGNTDCHGAITRAEFVDCTGHRLAATFNRGDYAGGLTLFKPSLGYYTNDAYVRIAGYYALYHAFAHDFDSTVPAASGFTSVNARDAQAYHRAVVRAYEAHMRDVIARMFDEPRSDAGFQLSLTRAIGEVEMVYVPVVVFMERNNLWGANRDRRNAFAVIDAMNQRIWWEWVWTQSNGPVTAGFVNLGSDLTYQTQRPPSGVLDGTRQFAYDFGAGPRTIPSLRAPAMDAAATGTDGFYFDADYPIPGEWWCYSTYPASSPELAQCLTQAARESKGGQYGPFGHYYGDVAMPLPCDGRGGAASAFGCGETNLGSAAEEWLWTFAGARAGLYLVARLALTGDPDLPANALGKLGHVVAIGTGPAQSPYANVSDRLGYGVSGFHGGAGRNDDLEWLWSADGQVRAVRTLSAGRHDAEAQNGRYSVGETATSPRSNKIDGDTWGTTDKQEYPGGIENHTPGPSSLYGSALFNTLLGDQTKDGLAGSLYDATHRNHVEEFQSWVWLFQGSYYRCVAPPSDDPADPACFALASTYRKPLFARPNPVSPTLRFDYLWRYDAAALDASHVSPSEPTCAGRAGVPWRRIRDRDTSADSPAYLHDEGGYGAYNELLQATGGLMRVLAARYPLNAGDPAFAQQRTDVIKPWYDEAYTLSSGILDLYTTAPPLGYGYMPDVENSTCRGTNPDAADPSPAMIAWQQGTGASALSTTVRRAMLYSLATAYYWWYDSTWVDAELF